MGWKAAQKIIQHWKILRGDNVVIIRGKDKGESGIIKRVIRSQNRVIVEGKNLVKKHIKQGEGHEGGIFSIEAPLHVSNVQVLDPVTGKPCKIGYTRLEDGTKVRVSRGQAASGAIIPRPEILKERRKPRPAFCSESAILNTMDFSSVEVSGEDYTKGHVALVPSPIHGCYQNKNLRH